MDVDAIRALAPGERTPKVDGIHVYRVESGLYAGCYAAVCKRGEVSGMLSRGREWVNPFAVSRNCVAFDDPEDLIDALIAAPEPD